MASVRKNSRMRTDLLALRLRQQFLVGVEVGRQQPGFQIRAGVVVGSVTLTVMVFLSFHRFAGHAGRSIGQVIYPPSAPPWMRRVCRVDTGYWEGIVATVALRGEVGKSIKKS